MANKRIVTLGFLLALAWLGMAARVAWVQVARSDYYREIASSQSIRRNVVAPKRGEILDRDMRKLAVNADVELEEGARARKLSRLCPMGALAGQVLGTVGRDGYGLSGLEYALDRDLRGTDGWRYARHDVKNRYYPGFDEKQMQARNGLNVVLTLDARLQEITEHALERGVAKAAAKQGVAVIVDPYTGDILAMANYPFYDPNARDAGGKDAWKNEAVVKVYEPGSTFKVVTTSALLEEKLIAPGDTLDGENGQYKIAGQIIRDTHPHGRISFTDALAYSSNICYAKVATRLPPATFFKYVRSFGFGMKSGVGLPAEESGVLKPVTEWSGRTQSTMAFGHEISATPLQMAMAGAAIANGGLLMKPRIVKAWSDNGGKVVREIPPRSVRRVMSEATAAQVKEMMKAVVRYGTAADIRSDRIEIAGKTGTAEKIDSETGRYVHGLFNSSFLGMVPADRPEFVCLVVLDEPSQLKYGGQSAAPIFREIVDRLLVNPDYPLARLARPAPDRGAAAASAGEPGDSDYVPALENASLASAAVARKGGKAEPVPTAGSGEHAVLVSGDGSAAHGGKASGAPGAMPDLSDRTLRDALYLLKDSGLEVQYEGAGRVIRQTPPPGAPVKAGQKCLITLGWMG
jgi:cell division protein FtsI/penicillin-binding protein 2